MTTNKGKTFPARALSRSEARKIVMKTNPGTRSGMRDRAMMLVLWRCGLRCDEALSLKLDDILWADPRFDREARLVVERPKGSTRKKADGTAETVKPPRQVGIEPAVVVVLEKWIAKRGNYDGYLFDTKAGLKQNDRDVRRMVARRAKRAAITRRVHPHAFRHTLAKEMEEEGASILDVRDALGHDHLATTEKYLRQHGALRAPSVMANRGFKL